MKEDDTKKYKYLNLSFKEIANILFFFLFLFSVCLPALAQTPDSSIDYDTDDDNLIDISNLEQLDAVRYDLDGNGMVSVSDMIDYITAFPTPAEQMGCPDTCLGYELTGDLDFKDIFSYSSFVVYDPWVNRNEPGFLPLGHIEGENLIPSSPSTPTNVFLSSPEISSSESSTPTAVYASTPSSPGHSCSSETSNAFTAIFEGNGHKIKNLFIKRSSLSSGLFQCIGTNGKVRNLGLELVDITGASQTGALAGSNKGIVSNSYVLGGFVIAYGNNVGGLIGNNDRGIISNSYSTANVTALVSSEGSQVGGLLGFNKGQVLNSFSAGDIQGYTAVGGLIGEDASVDSDILTKVFYNYSLSRISAETTDRDGLIGKGTTGISLFRYNNIRNFYIRVYNVYVVSNSFWSSDNNGITTKSLNGGLGFTNARLKSQTIGAGIEDLYFEWSNNNWDFGNSSQYPAIQYNNTQATQNIPFSLFGSPSVRLMTPVAEDLSACDSDSSDSEKPDCGQLLPGQRGPFLGSLNISGTNISTVFIPEITNYSANVRNNVTSITVSFRGASSLSTVKVNGNSLSGSANFSASVSLEKGLNLIEIEIENSTGKRSYIIKINRFLIPQMQSIILSEGSLSPEFSPDTFIYSTTVSNSVESITMTPSISDNEVVTIGGNTVLNESESPPIALQEGSNLITVTVSNILESQSYSFVIIRTALPRLVSLTLSSGDLYPEFNPKVTNYSARLTKDTTEIDIRAVGENLTEVRVNNQLITDEQTSVSIPLALGSNNITVSVSNSVGRTDYNLEITRISLPELKSIALSSGQLSPQFDPETGNYSVTVSGNVSSLRITPIAHSSEMITINGILVGSGEESHAISLPAGDLSIFINVTGYDSSRDYILVVHRVPLPELGDIELSHGVLSPQFSSDTTNYSVQVNSNVANLTLTPIAQLQESVSVNGELLQSQEEGVPPRAVVPLEEGSNTIIITAGNGVENKNYILNVTRAFIPELSRLILSHSSLSPQFSPQIKKYSVYMFSYITSFTLTPTVEHNETITVNGVAVVSGERSQAISLVEGVNRVTITVSNSNNESATYTLTVTRDTLPRLSMLSVSNGSLSPEFNSEITEYSVRVPNSVTSLTLTPTAHSAERIFINEEVMSGGSQTVPLRTGSNRIPILVLLTEFNAQFYYINIYRAYSPALLNLEVERANTPISFTASQTSYSVEVLDTINRILVSVTFRQEFTAMVNNEEVRNDEGGVFVDLEEGNNTITVTVANEFGEEKEYTIEVTRILAPKIRNIRFFPTELLTGQTELIGMLNPQFNPKINSYTLNVDRSVMFFKMIVTADTPESVTSISVNGMSINNEELSQTFGLSGLNTNYQIVIEDREHSNTYNFDIRRRYPPILDDIQLSEGSLSPSFSNNLFNYSVQLENSVKNITVTPIRPHEGTITVNGERVESGTASQTLSLSEGNNVIVLTVYNEVQTQEYILNIYRTPLPKLRSVNMSEGMKLSPNFHPEITRYFIQAPVGVETFTLSFTAYNDEDIIMNSSSISSDQQFFVSTRKLFEAQPIVVRVTSPTIMGERTYTFHIESALLLNIKVFLEGLLQ